MAEKKEIYDVWIGSLVIGGDDNAVTFSIEAFPAKLPEGFPMVDGTVQVALGGKGGPIVPLTVGTLKVTSKREEHSQAFPVEHIFATKEEAEANVEKLKQEAGGMMPATFSTPGAP